MFFYIFTFVNTNVKAQNTYKNTEILINKLAKVSDEHKSEIYYQIGKIYLENDSLGPSIKYLHQAFQYINKASKKNLIADINYSLGDVYMQIDDIPNSLKHYLRSYEISLEEKNQFQILKSSYGLGLAYYGAQDYSKSILYAQMALDNALRFNYHDEVHKIYNLLGMVYTITEKYDSARIYFKKIQEFGQKTKDSVAIGYSLINLSHLSITEGKNQEGVDYLLNALQIRILTEQPRSKATIYCNLGEAYRKLNKFSTALDYIKKSNLISESQGYLNLEMSNCENLYSIYKEIGMKDSALYYMERFMKLKNRHFDNERQKQIQQLNYKFELSQFDKNLAIYKQKIKIRNLYSYFTTFIILLLLVITILIYRSSHLKLRLQEEEKKQILTTIETQNRELVSLIINLDQKKSIISELENSIKKLLRSDKKTNLEQQLISIEQKIKTNINVDNDWDSIKNHFDQVHSGFFKSLNQNHPELTAYEQKQCAYIRMNLGTKDIARIHNISDRSVQMIRYRLKKKMNLSPNDDLIAYIHKL